MLLLLTSSQEKFSSLVEENLCDSDYFKLNLDAEFLKQTFISFCGENTFITQTGKTILISQVTCVWIKRQSILISSDEEECFCGFNDYCNYKLWKEEWNSIIKQLIEHLSFLNIPFFDESYRIARAERKLFQLDVAKKIGLLTPKTIVSNIKQDIIDFIVNNNNECILKLSTHPVFKHDENIYFVFSNKVCISDFKEFDSYINSPVIIQNYIPKKFEVRYTYVYGDHFVCKIDSQASNKSKLDYRKYDFAKTPYKAITPPTFIKENVNKLMIELGLNYGALDFIVTPNDEWYFLEINPVGQYGWIELLSGLPITSSIIKNIMKISKH